MLCNHIKRKSILQGQRHSYFRISIETFIGLTFVTIFALTIITLSQIGLINYDLVKIAFLFRTIRYLLLSLMHYFYTSHKRVFTLLKQKV